MRSAVVFGARQQYGFELCEKLLDLGCYVYAVDHKEWQTDQCEERWMLIGRNAHVELMLINQQQKVKEQLSCIEKAEYYIIPVLDYAERNYDKTHEQFLQMLDKSLSLKARKQFLFLYALSSNIQHDIFYKKIRSLIEKERENNHQVKEYYFPTTESHGDIYIQTENRQETEKIACESLSVFLDVILNREIK